MNRGELSYAAEVMTEPAESVADATAEDAPPTGA